MKGKDTKGVALTVGNGDGRKDRRVRLLLRKKGHVYTRARRAVVAALGTLAAGEASERHPTAEEVHRVARREHPEAKLAAGTAYTALAALEEAGVVRARRFSGTAAVHYDLDLSPHVDIRCRRCGRVEQVEDSGRAAALLEEVVGRNAPYSGTALSGTAEGTCGACSPPRGGAAPSGRGGGLTAGKFPSGASVSKPGTPGYPVPGRVLAPGVGGEGQVLAFDIETELLAAEVSERHADELAGASPWTRPDLFGFGVGVVRDVDGGEVWRFGRDEAFDMIGNLVGAAAIVSYNGEAFDFGVLEVEAEEGRIPVSMPDPVGVMRAKSVDLNALVMRVLDALPIDRQGAGRIRQGGLDGLARANGVAGKTGHAQDVPAMLRDGREEEVLAYCEQDTRIVADLYRLARERGTLYVDGYLKKGSERIDLGRLEVAVSVPDGDLASGTCERCDDGMPLDELVRHEGEVVCQPCAEETEDRRNLS